jgi:hypothetical protein
MSQWTLEQVWQLAPDPASASAARGLAHASKWQALGSSQGLIWGLCQGSGKEPYRAGFDKQAIAFRCSCPSRKQPCKHALALLALNVQASQSFAEASPPEWVTEWTVKRAEKIAKAAAPPVEKKAADPEQQEKRIEARRTKMADGLLEFRLWLQDLARQGVLTRKAGLAKELEARAKRLVDAQCSGAADALRALAGELTAAGADDRIIDVLARLDLLASAYSRLDSLPEGLAADVRNALGWPTAQEQALSATPWSGAWYVVGTVDEEADERVRSQRVWLQNEEDGRMALFLQYAFGAQAFPKLLPLDSRWQGELYPYPSAWPQRVAIKDLQALAAQRVLKVFFHRSCESALDAAAQALAANPFAIQVPITLLATLWVHDDQWWLVDEKGEALPVAGASALWPLFSSAGGKPSCWFGEWNGGAFRILTRRPAPMAVAT